MSKVEAPEPALFPAACKTGARGALYICNVHWDCVCN